MSKDLTDAAIIRAMLGSVEIAKYGASEQKAGMFRPRPRNVPAAPAKPQDGGSR